MAAGISLQSAGCARFRIEELQPTPLFSIPIKLPDEPNLEQTVQALQNGRVVYNFPVKPVTDGTYLYVTDPARSLVRVFSRGSTRPLKIFGNVNPAPHEDIKFVKIRAGTPGWAATDEDENIYIQLHTDVKPAANEIALSPEERQTGQVSHTGEVTPSQIVHLNDQDEILGYIGQNGYNSENFGLIIRMDAAEEGLLFVLHKSPELTLSVFRNGKKMKSITGLAPGTDQEKKKYLVQVEDIVPDAAAKFFIVSAAFRDKTGYNLEYRKIFRIDENDQSTELLNIEDPDDFFSWTRPDGGFYLTHTEEEGSGILFKIYNPGGEYLNNRLVVFPDIRSSWREPYLTLQGRIYTSRLFRGKYELYEWK